MCPELIGSSWRLSLVTSLFKVRDVSLRDTLIPFTKRTHWKALTCLTAL